MLNPETAKTMTVRELVAALDEQMREFGYAESSLRTYRDICARIVHYFEDHGVERFNVDLGQKFINVLCFLGPKTLQPLHCALAFLPGRHGGNWRIRNSFQSLLLHCKT